MLHKFELMEIGAGESGKSTIAKQMKILHLSGYSHEERIAFKAIVHKNIIECMKVLIEASFILEVKIDGGLKVTLFHLWKLTT